MDANAGGHGAVEALTVSCEACGAPLGVTAKFCSECGAAVARSAVSAEFKQITVLFADVVHSMDLAAEVGPERLREIMAELVDAAGSVVKRYGGTVDKFTGDGLMALFGAPVAFEDHAVRACLAALSLQEVAKRLAVEVRHRDNVDLELRVGLNSGQAIAGEIGSSSFGYTAIGDQVGIAQRMESVAPRGGVLISHSTARLVEHIAVLDDEELVRVKGRSVPIPACRLRAIRDPQRRLDRQETTLVGRQREVRALAAALDRAGGGSGGVVQIVGPAGVGKTRLVRETAAVASQRGFEIVATFCESHARDLPYYAATGLLRTLFGIAGMGPAAARLRVRRHLSHADEEDLMLLDDLLGIGGDDSSLDIDPDARRRRLIRLVSSAASMRTTPTVYVIEDAHWLDDASEWLFERLFLVLVQTKSLALLTFRPEYHGALRTSRATAALSLEPLDESDTTLLIREMLGSDPSVGGLGARIAERAAGNPFFAEEMVRDLAERRILDGRQGEYVCGEECEEFAVPATVQATIAARIDRLDSAAKRTLYAAAVIGSRFNADLLACVAAPTPVATLVDAELLEPVDISHYAFRHPLIRAVAYESQLHADRRLLHERVAAAIQQRDPSALEENAALIATHLEAAGNLRDAFAWYMRGAARLTNRDIAAARGLWLRARDVADRLPDDEPDRESMAIAPRVLLCGYLWCVAGTGLGASGLGDLRERCVAAGDQVSLVMGMSGVLVSMTLNHQLHDFHPLAADYIALLDSIGDTAMIVGLLNIVTHGAFEAGESVRTMQLAERVIALADNDAGLGSFFFESPLAWAIALRGLARCSLGMVEWRDDLRAALEMGRKAGGMTQAAIVTYGYGIVLVNGVAVADASVTEHTAEALRAAEQSGNEVSLAWAQVIHGVASVRMHGRDHRPGMELLIDGRRKAVEHGDLLVAATADIQLAECAMLGGDVDGAIDRAATVVKHLSDRGKMSCSGPATTVLVEALLQRGSPGDLRDAQAAVDGLAARITDPGYVFNELPLLRMRALLARAVGDVAAYRGHRDRYRTMSVALGFEGHIARAQAMS
ncbi:AAA family ATPase [Mycolicibacterium rufum]|uniref:AAA family ATPase n=1 Tax=Mycolicibacterium rufum TaxID=318424 RepID=A0ABY3UHY3_9MYCO|nr:adenylate/guanylate cyclase domain-containing protein [Mycolicibacterium rufum]ULP38104.1 AAA family ATPase [Mycolicibacterium rufum]